MLESLIESRHAPAYRGALGGGTVSLLVHSALITGAVYAFDQPANDAVAAGGVFTRALGAPRPDRLPWSTGAPATL
jgi:hypothetical protein